MLRACLGQPGQPCTRLTHQPRCDACTRARKKIRNDDRPIAAAVVAATPRCAWCGTTTDLTADHVTPLALGGVNHGERQTLCRPCNSSRGATPDS